MQIEDYYKLVYSIANHYHCSHIDYDDIVQAGMLGLVAAWQTYDATKAKFSTYAYRCIENAIRMEHRHMKHSRMKYKTIQNDSHRDLDLIPAQRSTGSISIDDMITMLPCDDREIVLARYRDGKSLSELALIYGTSYQAMNARITKIVRSIRETM